MRKILFILLTAILSIGMANIAYGKGTKGVKTIPQMYAYAVGFSPADSVVYITDVLILKNAQISNSGFLVGRNDYSSQFKLYLTEIDQPGRTCAVTFNLKQDKLINSYEKLKAMYEKKKYIVRIIDQTEFRFVVPTYEEHSNSVPSESSTGDDSTTDSDTTTADINKE